MIKAVIFDVDGVLLDSFEANFDFYAKLLEKFGYRGPTREFFQGVTHMSMVEALQALAPSADKEDLARMYELGSQPLDKTIKSLEAHMPLGTEEAVRILSKKYALGVVTSRVKSHIFEGNLIILKDYFEVVVGYEDTQLHKPNPEPLLKAVENLNMKPAECIYVGDALTDVKAGFAAGVPVVSYPTMLPGAIACAKNFAELPAIVAQL